MTRKKRHVAYRREIRFFRAMFLISVLSQTEGGDSIHRIFKHLLICRPRMGASAFSRCFAGPAENNGVFGRSRNMMIAVSIAVSQVDSSRTPVKIFCPFRNSYPHHRASSVLSYGISDLAIRLKWMLSAYAPAGRNWPPAMLVLFAGIRRIPQEPGRAGFRSVRV